MFYAVTESFLEKIFFCDAGSKMIRYLDYLEFFHRKMAETRENFKKISLSRRKQLSNAQFGQVESKKLKKLTDILFAASQKYINPEYESFRIKYDYFVNNIYKFGIN